MSLAIDVDKVQSVLIGNQWYPVDDDSFDLDAYEYVWGKAAKSELDPYMLLSGGQESEAGVPATGFAFKSDGQWIFGPISAIQAVRTSEPKLKE